MNLLLDCGNTRLKWAITSEDAGVLPRIASRGIVSYDAPSLAAWASQFSQRDIGQVCFSSVIADEQEAHIFAALSELSLVPVRFEVASASGTLRNAYATPKTLGVDRWAAAIGAWGVVGQSCLVINAGTATTIDMVETADGKSGVYRGGLILPGMDLMLQSLHQRAARLPQAEGRYCAAPDVADNTHDAITSGAIEATCGAIERMGSRLSDNAPWLIAGGNADHLKSVLGNRVQIVEDLVLEGLALSLLMRH